MIQQEVSEQDLINREISSLFLWVLDLPSGNLEGVLHGQELTKIEQENRIKVDSGLYLADVIAHSIEGGEPILYIGPRSVNPFLTNVREKVMDTLKGQHYQLSPNEFQAIQSADETLRIPYRDFDELRYSEDRSIARITIITGQPHKTKRAARAVAERIYGVGQDFTDYMEWLEGFGIKSVDVCIRSPRSLEKELKPGEPIAFASQLAGFKDPFGMGLCTPDFYGIRFFRGGGEFALPSVVEKYSKPITKPF